MKKKQIKKVPYLGIKKVIEKKEVRYIAVVAVKNVAHERHLFVEVYRNKKEDMQVPVARIVMTKKDFITYKPEVDEWTKQKVHADYYNTGLLWEREEDKRGRMADGMEKANILQNLKDIETLEKFTGEKVWNKKEWWEYIARRQGHINDESRNRAEKLKYERRMKALDERIKNTSILPEKSILSYADHVIFRKKHFLFYKKSGSFADIACTSCGGVIRARWRSGISYESQFQKHTEEPREGIMGVCPMCGDLGEYKCQGKAYKKNTMTGYLFLGNKYKENGMVMRFVEVEKRWKLQEINRNKGSEMFNASEELSGVEIARAYFEDGKKCQMDYQKYNPYSGKDFWDDCNLYGMNHITINHGKVMPQTYEEMKDTIFRYSGLQEYMAAVEDGNPIEYLKAYQRTPQLEMLVKMKLYGVAENVVKCRYGIVADESADRPDKFLGIRKEKVKLLMERHGDIRTLKVLQMENRMGMSWTRDIIEKLVEADIDHLEEVMKYTTVGKLLNAISIYAECEFGTGCTSAIERIKYTAITYMDYLQMRAQRGYDMSNTVYLRPRNLWEAHNKMVSEINKDKEDARLREAEEKFPLIRKNYRVLRKRYFYEDETYIIRPAKNAGEIVTEGRVLHHCVGGDSYLSKHNDNKSVILFLRFKEAAEVPYITIEIKEEHICQWYGEHDRKPNKEETDKWLKAYTTRLKCEEREELLAAAI